LSQNVQAPLRITVLFEGKLIGIVKDINNEGMSVSTPKDFERGKHAAFGLSVPGATKAVIVNCLVLDAVHGEGIEVGFMDLDHEAMGALDDILKKVEGAKVAVKASSGKKKVLLVEDTDQIRNVYKGRLMLDGYEVMAVESAMEAMKYLRDELPDLVLLDLVMPVMDGFKLLQIIRETPKMKDLPVIILSAKGAAAEIEKALQIGISGYLVKTTTSPVKLSQEIKDFFRKSG